MNRRLISYKTFKNHILNEGPEAEQNSIIVLTMAKWCPLENCTVLVLGSQYGIRLYDWDGSALFYKFDFIENGIGVDERQVTGKLRYDLENENHIAKNRVV